MYPKYHVPQNTEVPRMINIGRSMSKSRSEVGELEMRKVRALTVLDSSSVDGGRQKRPQK